MENILYLVHTTNDYNEDWEELRTADVEDYENQFPGVFMTIVTKQNVHTVDLYPDNKQILIFSRRLMEQHNYHINIRDYNGYISETNTYFPWNLSEAVDIINENRHVIGNEVIFHDSIPMKYLCLVIDNIASIPNNQILPNIPIENKVEPDTNKEPFYCYPLEKNYTGIDPFPESSREFFVNMAKTCNVDPNLPTDDIITQIKDKIPYLYENRNQQNIKVLKASTERHTIDTRKTRKIRRLK
jgi:hypothetical protein